MCNYLRVFAKETQSLSHYDFDRIPGYTEVKNSWQNFEGSFTYATDAVLNTNGRILFNLNGVDYDFALTIKSSTGLYDQLAEYGGRSLWEESKITEWELSRILNNKKLLKHTEFYEGGEKVDIKQLLRKVK